MSAVLPTDTSYYDTTDIDMKGFAKRSQILKLHLANCLYKVDRTPQNAGAVMQLITK